MVGAETKMTSLINAGTIEPVIMVGADNSPAPFGGSCYMNSILWGNYENYMVNDLINWMDDSFRTIPDREARGLLGQSMGGYGAFRYGILHKDKFCVLASHAGTINFQDEYFMTQMKPAVMQENGTEPPYFYDFYTTGLMTKFYFVVSGAGTPDTNSPQNYINPQIVQFPMDENGDYIDTVTVKFNSFDIPFLIQQLAPSDSVGVFFGDGENDQLFLYPGTLAIKDTLDLLGLPYEFYSHSGGHFMTTGFKERSLIFLDSLLMSPGPIPHIYKIQVEKPNTTLHCYPNPCRKVLNIEFELSQQDFIRINLYNLMGMEIGQIYSNSHEKGTHKLEWDRGHLHSGVYLLKLHTSHGTKIQKIIIQ